MANPVSGYHIPTAYCVNNQYIVTKRGFHNVHSQCVISTTDLVVLIKVSTTLIILGVVERASSKD